MHEASLATELVKIIQSVAHEHGATQVRSARVAVGDLSCVSPDALRFAFEVITEGTLAHGCELIVERVPLAVACAACGYRGEADIYEPGCPSCGGVPLSVTQGRALRLVSIDIDAPDLDAPELDDNLASTSERDAPHANHITGDDEEPRHA